MQMYRETLAFVLVVLLVGGGIALIQQGGMQAGLNGVNNPMQNTVRDFEQLGRYAHDYLNGYLSGSGWGTVLPQDLMKDEIKRLKIQYELAAEMVTFLYPLDHRLEPLIEQFALGFERALAGLENNDIELLLEAHQIFHQIDYEIFQHDRKDDAVI